MLGSKHNLKSGRLKARRKKAIIGRAVFTVICALSLWELIFWASGLKAFIIRDIEVVGATSIAESDVKNLAQKFLAGRYFFTIAKSNIFLYPRKEIERGIMDTFLVVGQAKVGYRNFHAINIKVVERVAGALWHRRRGAPQLSAERCARCGSGPSRARRRDSRPAPAAPGNPFPTV